MMNWVCHSLSTSGPNSSHWYTSQPLEGPTLQSMLTRILAVREVNQEQEAAERQSSATGTAANSLQWHGALLAHLPLMIFSATDALSDAEWFAVD